MLKLRLRHHFKVGKLPPCQDEMIRWCFIFSSGNNLELNHKKSVVCFVKLSLQIYTIANKVFQSTCVRKNFISVVGHAFYTKHADLVNVVKHNNGVSSH